MSDNFQVFRGSQLRNIKPPLKRKMVDDNATQGRDRSPFQVRKDFSKASYPERKRLRITTDKEEKDLTMTPSASKDIPSVITRIQPPKRKASRSPSGDRKWENMPRKKKRKDDEKVTKIWIIGSSYIRRAEEPAYHNFGKNFGLNANVMWFGKGGMRWNGVLARFYDELSTQSPPDILVVHAGGNDLGLTSSKELASQMKRDLMQLHEEFPSMTIAYSCINERQSWRYGQPKWINNDRKAVNRWMRKAAGCFNGEVIEHPLLRHFDHSVFLPDRVHFTRKGNEIFLTSIRNVIKKILQKAAPGKRP